MPNLLFYIRAPTLESVIGSLMLMGQQDVSLIQSVNCVRIYLSPLIALVELLFPIFILSNHTKALAWVRQRKLLACLPTTLCTAYQLKVQLFLGGGYATDFRPDQEQE